MSNILVVNKESASLADFTAELLKTEGLNVVQATAGEEALTLIDEGKAEVVVAGDELADGLALDFVKKLMKNHPLVNCAMVSSLSPDDFHEATEGLGLFMQLSERPGAEEAKQMLDLLNSIHVLMGT